MNSSEPEPEPEPEDSSVKEPREGDLSDEAPSSPDVTLTAGEMTLRVEVEEETLERQMPTPESGAQVLPMEEMGGKFGKFGFWSKTHPGGLMNRASGLGIMIILASIAAYATTGVCRLGSTTGNVVTVIGLMTFVAILCFGLWWVTHPPAANRGQAGGAGGNSS